MRDLGESQAPGAPVLISLRGELVTVAGVPVLPDPLADRYARGVRSAARRFAGDGPITAILTDELRRMRVTIHPDGGIAPPLVLACDLHSTSRDAAGVPAELAALVAREPTPEATVQRGTGVRPRSLVMGAVAMGVAAVATWGAVGSGGDAREPSRAESPIEPSSAADVVTTVLVPQQTILRASALELSPIELRVAATAVPGVLTLQVDASRVPVSAVVAVDPAQGEAVSRTVRLLDNVSRIEVPGLAAGPATWRVTVDDATEKGAVEIPGAVVVATSTSSEAGTSNPGRGSKDDDPGFDTSGNLPPGQGPVGVNDRPAMSRARAVPGPFAGFGLPTSGRADGGWIGAYRLEGQVVYRFQPRRSDASSDYGPRRATSDLAGSVAGPSARSTRRAAWVLSNFGAQRIKVQAAAVDAVVYHLLAGGDHRITRDTARRRIGATGERASRIYAYAVDALKRSQKYAGPYRITMDATDSVAGEPSRVTVRVESATRFGVPDVPVEVRYGGQTFKPRRTDSDGEITLDVTPTSGGLSTISATVTRLPHWRLFWRDAVDPKASDVAVAGRLASRTVRTSIKASEQQAVTITNASTSILTGQVLGGTYAIDGGTGQRDVTSSAYGPFSTSSSDCEGPASSFTGSVEGPGPFALPGFAPSVSGYYRWGVIAEANEFSVAGSGCGAAVRVQKRTTLGQIRPQGDADTVAIGEDFRVAVRIAGFDRTEPGHVVTSVLYGPFSTKDGVACAGEVAKTKTLSVSGNGDRIMGAVSVTNKNNTGWYGWKSSLSSGDLILGNASGCGVKVHVVD